MNNRHHVIPKNGIHINGINHESNIIQIDERLHAALHRVFANRAPHEQIQFLVKLNAKVLTKEFKEGIQEFTHLGYGFTYRDGLYRIKHD